MSRAPLGTFALRIALGGALGALLGAVPPSCARGQPGAPSATAAATARAPSPGMDASSGADSAPDGAGCRADADCAGGFCDLGRCARAAEIYGAACAPAPRGEGGVRDGKLHTCGAYVCIERRCRSCSSDEHCQSELGAPRCSARPGRPGMRCGAP